MSRAALCFRRERRGCSLDTTAPRRSFLSGALTGGALALARPALGLAPGPEDATALVTKVERAMLAMQRRAWEQGVASQALVELGDAAQVVLLAKDALVNQAKDGRLALNGDRAPVTDPASNGEPALFAYKLTGDPVLKGRPSACSRTCSTRPRAPRAA